MWTAALSWNFEKGPNRFLHEQDRAMYKPKEAKRWRRQNWRSSFLRNDWRID
jgi:hypothetical protein